MVVSMRQEKNASLPIEVTLFGIVTLLRLLQTKNACSPIEVTLFGIVMLVRLLQLLNAPLFNPVRTPHTITLT